MAGSDFEPGRGAREREREEFSCLAHLPYCSDISSIMSR